MLNVSTLLGTHESASDALRYGVHRHGEHRPKAASERRPVVVWNCTRACNLTCEHCYASAKATPFPDELTTAEARAFLDDLAQYGVPAVLVSGGEPLVRPDLLDLIAHGRANGLRFTLSSNGTLIDDTMAARIAEVGVTYVGISIDGPAERHDVLRRQAGAWDKSIAGFRALGRAGVRRGVRFTLTPQTRPGLDDVLQLVLDEGIERICLYHLVPAGRGTRLDDVTPEQRRETLEHLFEFAATHPALEVLTVDNPSDGAYLMHWLERRDPEAAAKARRMLEWNTGARGGTGIGISCVDELGNVHPDQFTRFRTVGNIRQRPFSQIWSEPDDEYLITLRSAERPVAPECAGCSDYAVCGGGFRARAEAATGDAFGFDPSCALVGV